MTRLFSHLLAAFCLVMAALSGAAQAQQAWVQIEAHPSLNTAQARARDYAARLDGVSGFSLGGGWYGIALGPFGENEAANVLRSLRAQRRIPSDSYVVQSTAFNSQFYPVGRDALSTTPRDTAQEAEPQAEPVAEPAPAPAPQPAEETRAEALRAESRLSRAEREQLQIALQWAGYYEAAIDGAFGRGTRGSMAAWQEANGYEATGVLTTLQRAALIRQYNSVLEGLGLQAVTDREAGITMQIPTAVVAFDRYEYPFAHYEPTGEVEGARLSLISQRGDQTTLFGLYEIMQTLEIVPVDGPRERGASSFTIQGSNGRITSFTEARLVDGAVKGFTLVWPTGDEDRRTRLLDEMRASFRTDPGAIDPSFVDEDAQAVDLLSGLQIRKPMRSRSGVYLTPQGAVLTVTEAVEGCGRITLEGDFEARVAARNDALGLAVVIPQDEMAPMGVARMAGGTPRIQSEVAVSGYSYEGALGAPTLTHGTLADIRGLSGEDELMRLDLSALPGDAGGPVLDGAGNVLGLLLPAGGGARQLPADASFAVKAGAARDLLTQAGIRVEEASVGAALDPVRLTNAGRDMTALVGCWE